MLEQSTRGGMKVMSPGVFCLRNYKYSCNELYIYYGYSLHIVEITFHNVSFIINTLFPPLLEMLHAIRIELFADMSELFIHAAFQLIIICKMASSESILQGSKR